MQAAELSTRLDDILETDAYADADASANGLQVGPADAQVERVAVAVDAATATIDAAASEDVDMLVTHHGLSWGGIERLTGTTYARVAALVNAGMALYVSHLPLDGHPVHGNAAGLADLLDLDDRDPFGAVGGTYAGRQGRLPEPVSLDRLADRLTTELDIGDGHVRTLAFGPDQVQDVAILTGSGTDWLNEAVDAGADLLLTGEGKGQVYHEARELEINVILAGHYATETFGVRSLAGLLEDWGLETTVIECPTGL
ncbi:MAG: Nif3-like dinuclear metal center hexameric protein [Salinirussus sp.]